jgi:hypothetical protein
MIYLKQLSSTRHRDPYQGLIAIGIELVFLVIISFLIAGIFVVFSTLVLGEWSIVV